MAGQNRETATVDAAAAILNTDGDDYDDGSNDADCVCPRVWSSFRANWYFTAAVVCVRSGEESSFVRGVVRDEFTSEWLSERTVNRQV